MQVSFITANYVAREIGYQGWTDWGAADRATVEAFHGPRFGQKFDELCRLVVEAGFENVDLWVAHLNPFVATDSMVDEAAAILKEQPESEFKYGDDFGAPDETILSTRFEKPVFVHRYPAAVKSFYMKRDPADPTKALCVDMLGTEGVGELIGGSQREDDLDAMLARIKEHELPQQFFEWYLDLRRYGTVPHAGFGLGLERFVGWIAGVEHIRECSPFPRTMYRIEP